jgi:phosphoglycerate kinase
MGDISHLLGMEDIVLRQKRVMIRVDFNVPIEHGHISNARRLEAVIPTVLSALAEDAAVILVSHFGRPQEGKYDPLYSLAPVADYLTQALGFSVKLIADWQQGCVVLPGQVVLLENIRFYPGEEANDSALSQALANICDVYVMDAFACAHRKHASTYGVMAYVKTVCAGPLLLAEVNALNRVLENPARPLVAIVGGAKVSTKFKVLNNLVQKVDQLIVGGGIANTFIAASGLSVGASLYEPSELNRARMLLDKLHERGGDLPLPVDVVVASELGPKVEGKIKSVQRIEEQDKIFDIGPDTIKNLCQLILSAKTVLWNGPMGVFEQDAFSAGTRAIGEAIIKSGAFSIAGGGDTLSAIDRYGWGERLSYISTGGGAFLECVEGELLPAIEMLERYAKRGDHA